MRFWFFSADPDPTPRSRLAVLPVRPLLEPLENRCLPSGNLMAASATVAESSASTAPAAVNTIASLPHDQIHVLQAQSQEQTDVATLRLEVEEIALGILQLLAPQVPAAQPVIAFLNSAIPAQQAAVSMLQVQTNLLNQLDDLQDQGLILNAMIQNARALIPVQQQFGDLQVVNMLQSIIAADQATVQALQPQIAAVEVEVSTFV